MSRGPFAFVGTSLPRVERQPVTCQAGLVTSASNVAMWNRVAEIVARTRREINSAGNGDAVAGFRGGERRRRSSVFAVCSELESLHRLALEFATGHHVDLRLLRERYRFLRSIYKHHCNADDEVIFSALDIRVKNVAQTYSLEHQGEGTLFDHLFELLNSATEIDESYRRELASSTGVRHLLASTWLKNRNRCSRYLLRSLSMKSKRMLLTILNSIFTWLGGKSDTMASRGVEDSSFHCCLDSSSSMLPCKTSRAQCPCEGSKAGKRKYPELTEYDAPMHPIDEIKIWHNSINKEMKEITDEARKIQLSGDFSDLSSFDERLQYIAESCTGQDHISSSRWELSFSEEHDEEENQHFHNEEIQVLPLARKNFSFKKQQEILYQSLAASFSKEKSEVMLLLKALQDIGFDLPVRLLVGRPELLVSEVDEWFEKLKPIKDNAALNFANALLNLLWAFELRATASWVFQLAIKRGCINGISLDKTLKACLWEIGSPFLPWKTKTGLLVAKAHSLRMWKVVYFRMLDALLAAEEYKDRSVSVSVSHNDVVKKETCNKKTNKKKCY
ncbi:hypothetical protein HID58_067820 [Brassica napus]|uniref:Uncharacterized protein n=1 Tax=Brassica napus TaxID=3708 RepID=A0ABQ7ZJL3_BRANA|nr:hypothetical protein HID58_067820 [Brassica napus]